MHTLQITNKRIMAIMHQMGKMNLNLRYLPRRSSRCEYIYFHPRKRLFSRKNLRMRDNSIWRTALNKTVKLKEVHSKTYHIFVSPILRLHRSRVIIAIFNKLIPFKFNISCKMKVCLNSILLTSDYC